MTDSHDESAILDIGRIKGVWIALVVPPALRTMSNDFERTNLGCASHEQPAATTSKALYVLTAENDGDEQAIEDAEHYIKGMYIYSTLYTKSL